MVPVESSYLESYVQKIEEGNLYYSYFSDSKVRDPYHFVQLDLLQKSKEKRIEANSYQKVSENMRLIGVNYIEEAGISIVGQDEIIESYDKALKWFVSAYGQAIYEFETGQYGTGIEQIEALRGHILDVYTFFLNNSEDERKARLAKEMMKAIEVWEITDRWSNIGSNYNRNHISHGLFFHRKCFCKILFTYCWCRGI